MVSQIALLALPFITTELVYVRHGETEANATGRYNSRTLNTFSKKGEAQVKALTEKLREMPAFDAIVVSPSPRVLKTVEPYLRRSGFKATVWPLLYECCTERPRQKAAVSFSYGAAVEIPSGVDPLRFTIPPGNDRLPAPRNYGEGLAQVNQCLAEFVENYRGKRVLVVGHSQMGGLFLRALTGRWRKVENATPMAFTLNLYEPLPPR